MYISKFGSRRRSCAKSVGTGKASLQGGPRSLRIEALEQRTLLSATAVFDHIVFHPFPLAGSGVIPAATPYPSTALIPVQIQTAYGINAISLGGVAGTGSGQTIAIVDAYDDPTIVSDAATFNTQFGLQQFNVSGGPTLTVLNPTGGATPPTASGYTGWSVEESLDVEWAHAIAPKANIILFEADSDYNSDLYTAVQTAAAYSGVSVVSMSWGEYESSDETSSDSYFTTPTGHAGVTFLASTGDSGSPGGYPAYSPNVVAVGGTTLTLNGNNYVSETGWSGSGGGQSSYEPKPTYQQGVQSSGWRQIPDVSFDADPNSGVAVYDSYDYNLGNDSSAWLQVGGTSVAAPCWAGLIGIADQLRASRSLGTLNGLSQTLPALYAIDAADFHDIAAGSNGGYSAGLGYDMVTGLGSSVANRLVPDLALYPAGTVTSPATTVSLAASTNAPQYSQSITFAATVSDTDTGVVPPAGTVTFKDGGTVIGTATLTRGMALFTDSSLALGSHTITAVYGGNGTFTGSTSSLLPEVVIPLATVTSLSDSARSITYGQTETLTATVRGLIPGTAMPTGGTVTFTDQATSATLGTAFLAAGTAAIKIHSLTAGTHGIVATYHGDGLYFQGSSGSLPLGTIGTVAGNGLASYGGDGGAATAAQIDFPSGVAVDAAGDLFIADTDNNRIREVNASTHVITTVAGNGNYGYSGDGGLATNAELDSPYGIAVDAAGDLFIADSYNSVIREVNVGTHIISTVAGNGDYGYSGDGGLATAAELDEPMGVTVDASGNLFIADSYNSVIRKVTASTHDISTVAGNGNYGYSGNGGLATAAELDVPTGVAVDASGDFFIADSYNNVIREVAASTHDISTVAGNGDFGYGGDGGLATNAELDTPGDVVVDVHGNLFIADSYNNVIREVNASTHDISTVAGGGVPSNVPATDLSLAPSSVALDAGGDLFIADTYSNCICEVNAATGLITTVAGNGTLGYTGNGGLAVNAELDDPYGIAVDAAGDLFIADTFNNCVREVNASTHVISTVAGNGNYGYSGDGGPATNAELDDPTSIAVDGSGNLFIADIENNCVREVNASTHDISTVAGNGTAGYSGDGGPATNAELYFPSGIAVDAGDDLFIADYGNSCIREVTAGTHVISTLAGNGSAGYSGDGGPAANAELNFPFGIALDAGGDLFIADTGNSCVREVSAATHVITTVAGDGNYGYNGDGGLAAAAQLAYPYGIAVDAGGNLFIADTENYRVREAGAPIINVAPAALTVTANNQTKSYGAPLPALTAGYSGLVNGDTASSLATQPTLSTTATASSPAGSYVINVSGAVDPNYNISYVKGTLTITAATTAVSSVTPNAGPTTGGAAVTITGTNLGYVTTVYFGATAASNFTVVSNTQIVAASPAGTVGTVDVTVATAGGASPISPADRFRYVAAPVVSAIDTTSGSVWGNTLVNIYGSNLADATTGVFFGTTPAAAFAIVGQGQIMALSPAGAGTVDVTVVTAGGSSPIVPAVQFAYLAATMTWDGVSSGNWTDAQWSGAGLPYPDKGANALIGSGSVVQVASQQAANALAIQANAQVAVGPGAVLSVTTDTTVTDGGTLNVDPNGAFSSGGSVTLDTGGSLSGGPIIAAAYQLDDGTASADLSGPGGLIKDSGGIVILSGANSYAGGTVVRDGTLVVADAGALPDSTNLTIGPGATLIFDPGQAAASSSPVGLAASAAGIAAASQTSTPIIAASAPNNVPVTAFDLSIVSPAISATPGSPAETPAGAASAFVGQVAPSAATSPAISSVTIDAVFQAGRPAVDPTVSAPGIPQSARPWAWLAAMESSWDSSNRHEATGSTLQALDTVLARYGL